MVDVCSERPVMLSSDGDNLTRSEFRSSSADSGYVCYAPCSYYSILDTIAFTKPIQKPVCVYHLGKVEMMNA